MTRRKDVDLAWRNPFLLSAILLAACSTAREPSPADVQVAAVDLWKFEPGKVEVSPSKGITSSFTVVSDINGNQSRTGGACLVFQYRNAKRCEANSDCDRVAGPRGPPIDPGAGQTIVPGSCISDFRKVPGTQVDKDGHPIDSGQLPIPSSTCWIKEEETNPCDRNPTTPRDPFKKYSLPTTGQLHHDPLNKGQPVRWRAVACQNLTPFGCGNVAGKEGVDRKTRYGTPSGWITP